MSLTKFDNIDRKRVIRAVEGHFEVKLSQVSRRPKWLRDETGKSYWVLGGYEEWHGIPEEMMDVELQAASEGILVVAVRTKSSMEIFSGTIGNFVRGREKLYRVGKTTGDYQFTYKMRGSHLLVEQLPIVSLEKIKVLPYESEEKEKDKAVEAVKKLFGGMSEKERKALVKSLNEKEP